MYRNNSFNQLCKQWKNDLKRLHDDYYYSRQNHLWKLHAKETLPALIAASDMLICGEDLGLHTAQTSALLIQY